MPVYNNKEYIRIVRPLPSFVKRDKRSIPFIEPVNIDISNINNGIWLINSKNANSKDKNADSKIVISFNFDDVLIRNYNNMDAFMHRTSRYLAVSSFDFSMDNKMDNHQITCAVYNNRWSGAYMQANGRCVIPTIGWLKSDTYDICFSGIRDGGTVLISTLGTNNIESYEEFITGYRAFRNRFPKTKIICVGDKVSGIDDDVCMVKYTESFGNWEKYPGFWQPSFVNWDSTLKEVI